MEDLSSPPVVRSVLWTRRDQISLEYFQLRHGTDDISLSGSVLASHDGKPLRLEYTVQCDPSWVTRSVRIRLTHDAAPSELTLVADDRRRWWSEGKELAAVAGCVDVDISLSPSTNTLP